LHSIIQPANLKWAICKVRLAKLFKFRSTWMGQLSRRPASSRFSSGYDLWETQRMARRTSDRPLYSKLAGLYYANWI